MRPDQYHTLIVALDRVMEVFQGASAELLPEDREVFQNLEQLRSRVLKAESGHPFLLQGSSPPGRATEPGSGELAATPNEPPAAAPKTIRVLLADDEDSVRTVVRVLLGEEKDFTVVAEARNGKEAVEMAGAFQPDIIVMDLNMPVLDGVAATREALQASPKSKVIVFSANHDEPSLRLSAEAGAVGYIVKPVNRKVLIATLRDVCRGNAAFHDRDSRRVDQQP